MCETLGKKMFKRKTLSTATLILLLAFSAYIAILPKIGAHTPAWNIPTYAYVALSPNTIGIGDYTLITTWLDKFPPTAGGEGGDLWRGFKIEITKPDGTKVTRGPITSSQIGTGWFTYFPDQTGDYNIVFSWPGQTLSNGTGIPNNAGAVYVGDFFMPSTSDPVTLRVTSQKTSTWQEPSVTTDYWTRPIPTANRDSAQLLSNYLKGGWLRYGTFQEQGIAPNSAHILYAKQIIEGGLADESFGGVKYDTTDYENFFPAPIVQSGKIFYNAGTYPNYGYYCVDLKTGETLWYKNGTDNGLNNPVTLYDNGGGGNLGPWLAQTFPQLAFGQLFHYYGVNGEGVLNHLWATQTNDAQNRWYLIDANTGNWELTLKNVPSGTQVTSKDGSILLYSYNSNTGQFLAWNTTQSIPPPSPTGTGQQQWEPRTGATIDAVNDTSWTQYGPNSGGGATGWTVDDIRPRSGYTMNVTGPKGLPGLSSILRDQDRVAKLMLFSDFRNLPTFGSSDMYFRVSVVRIDEHVVPNSPQPDKTETQNNNLGYGVTLLWDKNITKPLGGNLTFSLGPISYEENVITVWSKETRQWWGYSLTDGSLLWGPTKSQPSYDMYGSGGLYAYGKLFSGYFGGILHCYDMKTGKLLWNYTAQGIGYESPYGNYPIAYGGGIAAADGKIFVYSTEHSPTQPLWRGAYLRAINATDGTEVWKSLNYVTSIAIADGCVVVGNNYDNRMYVYGKGPSATSISAPNIAVAKGTPVLIQGTVTDQSPGAKGTPAIADADQPAWMDYLYMKQTIPTNVKGVQVKLTAMDPNGNIQDVGTALSDMKGLYAISWTPPVPGLYKVTATFAGSNSYGSSNAETAFIVMEAPTAVVTPPTAVVTPAPTSTVPSASPAQTSSPASPSPSAVVVPPTSGMPATTYIAIGVAIVVIVAAAAALVLRKRK